MNSQEAGKPDNAELGGTSGGNAQTSPSQTISEEDIALANLYRDAVINHAVNATGYQQDIDPSHRHELYNPLCGDKVEVQFRLADGLIEAAAFDGESCAICMASASMLCQAAPGMTPVQLQEQNDLLVRALRDKQSKPGLDSLQALLAVRRYPARVRCALLPWEAAVKALAPSGD